MLFFFNLYPVISKLAFQVAWYNKSLSSRDCPVEEIMETKNFLLHRDVTVRQRVVQAFEPQFHLADIKVRIVTVLESYNIGSLLFWRGVCSDPY